MRRRGKGGDDYKEKGRGWGYIILGEDKSMIGEYKF